MSNVWDGVYDNRIEFTGFCSSDNIFFSLLAISSIMSLYIIIRKNVLLLECLNHDMC